ncbi:MAG: nodulation protein NfeD [Ignavibacteria bacterium]|jgi:membrane-bound serine protease (ClpP class)|nr:nodulation protein NfeD [Ignavibacteria bacterium]MCU7502117.1 nodulation protein NfeD [Ignavibacteria bacterium]MCU7515519.1 nodulation protein NfeD [Ignavibacteria bacterium]
MKVLVFILALFSASLCAQPGKAYIISIDGAITQVAEDYLALGISKASENGAECLIVRLNTPGGLLSSTRDMVSEILRSPVPVIIYVTPEGAQAASAGVFITLSAHIAAMTPGTNIGAAHPVTLQGQADSVMLTKATNDAAAFIRTISEKRNRNIQWAEDAVRKSLSITETEALKTKVIDLIAKNVRDLLEKVNGMKVRTSIGEKILKTGNLKLVEVEMTFQQKMLKVLSDPNIAYILLILGMYGIMFELYNPGSIFPGVAGAISLILAFYAMHTLPINYAGMGLIILSVILFILEIKIVSHGLLAIGGAISLFLGSMMLFQTSSFLEVLMLSKEIVIAIVLMTVIFFLFVIGMGIRAQKLKTSTGVQGIIGEAGVAISNLSPIGQIHVHGEIWSAESLEGGINKGERVIVENVDGMNLKVRKEDHGI